MSIDIFTSPIYANGTYAVTAATGIPYLMLHRGGQGIGGSVMPTAINIDYICIVRWSQRLQWEADMIGTHAKAGSSSFHRINPQVCFFRSNLFCIALNLLESVGELAADLTNVGACAYDYAIYKATFSPLPYDLGSDDEAQRNGEITRYVERDRQDVGESIQAVGQFVFPVNNTPPYAANINDVPVPTPPALMVSMARLTYTQYYVPGDAPGTTPGGIPQNYVNRANSFYGTVNSVPFDNYYTIGQILYLGLVKQERLPGTPSANVLWKMVHALAYRAQGWNVAYNPNANTSGAAGVGDWQVIVNQRTRLLPYATSVSGAGVDHNQLFQP